MPITALSQTVVRALGSSQVLTTPVSLVKELVENALDAHASSIAVEISSNTLDCIQVKDNGHGIAPEDREDVAKRHFTSKIRDMTELKELGGRYLGFRGEALASAAELVGGLEIVTRIDGEIAACKLFIGRTGQVLRYVHVNVLVLSEVDSSATDKRRPATLQAPPFASQSFFKTYLCARKSH